MEFGKFKDATSLFEAYKNLEKSFTKKCQEAKELSKKLEEAESASLVELSEKNNGVSVASAESTGLSFAGETLLMEGKEFGETENLKEGALPLCLNNEIESKGEEALDFGENFEEKKIALEGLTGEEVAFACNKPFEAEPEEKKDVSLVTDAQIKENNGETELVKSEEKQDLLSRFKSKEWRREVAKFFALNEEAKSFRADIAKLIVSSPALWKDENCLLKAFQIVKNNSPASNENETLTEKPNETAGKAVSKALLGEQSKNAFDMTVREYLENFARGQKNLPRFVRSSKSAGAIGLTKPREIKSLNEAKDFLLKNYFK